MTEASCGIKRKALLQPYFTFDVPLSNSQGDPTEHKHLKGMVALLVGEDVLCC